MTVWWFFKETKYASAAQQANAAEKTKVPEGNWIGSHRKARFRNCQNIVSAIYSKVEANNNIPRSDTQPISTGDTVWVYNIFCLGQHTPDINATIKRLHNEGIALHIYTCEYYDDIDLDVSIRKDYSLVTRLLNELGKRTATRTEYKNKQLASAAYKNKTPKKAGRKEILITLDTLTDKGYRIIEKYCKNQTPYERKSAAFEAMQKPECYNQKHFEKTYNKTITLLSDGKFKLLVREFDDRTRAAGGTTIRTKPYNLSDEK